MSYAGTIGAKRADAMRSWSSPRTGTLDAATGHLEVRGGPEMQGAMTTMPGSGAKATPGWPARNRGSEGPGLERADPCGEGSEGESHEVSGNESAGPPGRPSRGRGKAPAWLRWGELFLTAAVALAAARLALTIFAPLGLPDDLGAPPSKGRTAQATAVVADPFRTPGAPVDAGPAMAMGGDEILEETSLDLVLHGVVVDGGQSTAVIRTPDGRQRSFAIGDTVWEGVTLESAREDQVTIRRGGVRETLTMVNRERRSDTAAAQPARRTDAADTPPAPAAAIGFDLGSWTDIVRITPRPGSGGIELEISPGPQEFRFEQLGLRAGDVLVAVNGRRLAGSPDLIAAQIQAFSANESIDVVVRRDGVELPLMMYSKPGRGSIDDY